MKDKKSADYPNEIEKKKAFHGAGADWGRFKK
jgi:hypothetical protein